MYSRRPLSLYKYLCNDIHCICDGYHEDWQMSAAIGYQTAYRAGGSNHTENGLSPAVTLMFKPLKD